MKILHITVSNLKLALKQSARVISVRCLNRTPRKPPWRVLFFGSDEFSIYTLRALCEEYRRGKIINKLDVVTTIKGKPNSVKIFADRENLNLHKWPFGVNHGEFDVGLVVSFGHLIPEEIITKFEFGMLNVHASLLPRWRGAAPIIYALANGDTQTGITIMRISPRKFDVGDIIAQSSVEVPPDMKMQHLHQILGETGARKLISVLEDLPFYLENAKPQPPEGICHAPKIDSNFCKIQWKSMYSEQIFNLYRALDGVMHLTTNWHGVTVKLMGLSKGKSINSGVYKPGSIEYNDEDKLLRILCADSKFINVEKVGVPGKKPMTAKDFHNGYVKKMDKNSRFFE